MNWTHSLNRSIPQQPFDYGIRNTPPSTSAKFQTPVSCPKALTPTAVAYSAPISKSPWIALSSTICALCSSNTSCSNERPPNLAELPPSSLDRPQTHIGHCLLICTHRQIPPSPLDHPWNLLICTHRQIPLPKFFDLLQPWMRSCQPNKLLWRKTIVHQANVLSISPSSAISRRHKRHTCKIKL